MAIDELSVVLSLDADEFQIEMKKSTDRLESFEVRIQQVSQNLRQNQRLMRNWSNSIAQSVTGLNSALQLMDRFGVSVSTVAASFIEANSRMENLNVMMRGLSDSSEDASSAVNQAASDVKYLRDMAASTPLTIDAIGSSFVKLKSAGLDPTSGSMDALVNSVARFGGGASELDRASIAIQQMGSKGVVSMEELRQQLGEAVPNAMRLMADGLGISMAELSKVVESGTLDSTVAMNAMFTQMRLQNAGSAQAMMNTWDGLVTQIKAETDVLMTELGDSGIWDGMKDGLRDILSLVESGDFKEFVADIGDIVSGFVSLGRVAVDNIDKIMIAVQALGAYLAGRFVATTTRVIREFIASIVAASASAAASIRSFNKMQVSLSRVNTTAKSTTANLIVMSQAMNNARKGTGGLMSGVDDAAKAVKKFNDTMHITPKSIVKSSSLLGTLGGLLSRFAGPAGVAAYAVFEVANALDLFGGKVEEVREKADRGFVLLDPEEFNELLDAQKKYQKESLRLTVEFQKTQRAVRESSGFGQFSATQALQGENIDQQITKNKENIKKVSEEVNNQISLTYEDQSRRLRKAIAETSAESDKARATAFQAEKKEIARIRDEKIALNAGNESQIRDEYAKNMNATTLKYSEMARDARIERINAEASQATKEVTDNSKIQGRKREAALRAIETVRKELIAAENQLYQQSAAAIAAGNAIIDSKLSDTEKIYRNRGSKLSEQIKRDTAIINGSSQEMAQINAKLAMQKEKNVEYTIDSVQSLSSEAAQLTNLLSKMKEYTSIQKEAAESTRELNAATLNDGGENPFTFTSNAADSLRLRIADLKAETLAYAGDSKTLNAVVSEQGEAIKSLNQQLSAQSLADLTAQNAKIDEQVKKLKEQNATEAELKAMRAEASRQQLSQLDTAILKYQQFALKATDPAMKQALDDYIDSLKKLKKEMANVGSQSENLFPQTTAMMKDWMNVTKQMDQAWSTMANSMADSLTEFVMTGKFSFGDLADVMIREMVRIAAQAAVSQIFQLLGFAVGGPAGAAVGAALGSAVGGSAAGAGATGAASLSSYASAGTMGATGVSPYATTQSDNMQSSISAIPSTPQGQVAPNVSVNVINESGTAVNAEQQDGPKFDGERWVLDVVMKAMNRPGNFRSAIKGTTRQ